MAFISSRHYRSYYSSPPYTLWPPWLYYCPPPYLILIVLYATRTVIYTLQSSKYYILPDRSPLLIYLLQVSGRSHVVEPVQGVLRVIRIAELFRSWQEYYWEYWVLEDSEAVRYIAKGVIDVIPSRLGSVKGLFDSYYTYVYLIYSIFSKYES